VTAEFDFALGDVFEYYEEEHSPGDLDGILFLYLEAPVDDARSGGHRLLSLEDGKLLETSAYFSFERCVRLFT